MRKGGSVISRLARHTAVGLYRILGISWTAGGRV